MNATLTRIVLSSLLIACACSFASAQCDGCQPDLSCTVEPAFPTLCPETAPNATVGEYYEEDFTFWMPSSFTDPGTGFEVTLMQLTVTGVTGLPFGLQFTTNSPTGVYFPQDDEFGCARICGTPFGPGEFPVTISVVANVSASGITLDVPTSFPVSITVLPGSGGTASFSFTPTSGCGAVSANFQALIDGAPSPTSYAWDFGNGSTSTSSNPPVQTYSAEGTFQVTLQTTISGYLLQSLNVASVNGSWCGDIEEPELPIVGCTGSPDPYFVLTNASGGTFTSGAFTDVSSASWSDMALLLDDPPYSISIYDEDVVSGDDLLGTYNLTITGTGTYFFNVAGGTAGSIVITSEPQQVYNDTAFVTVLPLPEVVIDQNSVTSELCAEDPGLASYQWLLDGMPVADETGPCTVPSGPGLWQLVASNAFGCSDTSNVIVVCPVFNIAQNGNVIFVPSGYDSYQWTLNGAPIGGNDSFVFLQGDGLYAVAVVAENGCVLNLSFLWDTTGIEERTSMVRMEVFPVPSDGLFNVVAEGLASRTVQLSVLDLSGRLVLEREASAVQGRIQEAIALQAAPGTYVVRVLDDDRSLMRRVVVR